MNSVRSGNGQLWSDCYVPGIMLCMVLSIILFKQLRMRTLRFERLENLPEFV